VSIGFVRRRRCVVAAISHAAGFGRRMNLIRDIGDAMDEAIDQEALVLDPPPPGAEPLLRRAHEALRAHGPDSVCSVPVAAHGTVTGALTFELSPGRELAPDVAQALLPLAGFVLPILASKRREERHIGAKLWDAVRGQAAALAEPGHPGRRLVAIVVTALATGSLWAWNPDGSIVSGWPSSPTGAGYAAAGNLLGSETVRQIAAGYWGGEIAVLDRDGSAVAGCGPEEMGIGPVFAVPKLLKRHGLTIDDIRLDRARYRNRFNHLNDPQRQNPAPDDINQTPDRDPGEDQPIM